MRRLVLLACLLTCALPGAASARKPCALGKHDKVVVKTSGAVIERRGDGNTYRGCLKRVDRWRVLHVDQFDGYSGSKVGKAALGGRYAAVSVFTGDHYNAGDTTVEIVNLRTGHRRAALLAGHSDGDLGGAQSAVSELAVSGHGTLGWIAQQYEIGTGDAAPAATVFAHDAGGTRVLDTADFEGMKRLRFSGTTLHWTHDGNPRSAAVGDR
jgi:hypothetical protein